MKKFIVIIAAALILLGAIGFFYSLIQKTQTNKQIESEKVSLLREIQYGERLSMDSNINIYSEKIESSYSSTYKKVLFCEKVPDKVEDDVIYMYPSEQTALVLEKLNRFAEWGKIDLAKYNLTLPVTMADLLTKSDQITQLILEEEPSMVTLLLGSDKL